MVISSRASTGKVPVPSPLPSLFADIASLISCSDAPTVGSLCGRERVPFPSALSWRPTTEGRLRTREDSPAKQARGSRPVRRAWRRSKRRHWPRAVPLRRCCSFQARARPVRAEASADSAAYAHAHALSRRAAAQGKDRRTKTRSTQSALSSSECSARSVDREKP